MSLSNSFLSFGLFFNVWYESKEMAYYIPNVLCQKLFGRKCDVIPFRLSYVIELFTPVAQHLQANLLFCLNILQLLLKVWIKIELFICKSHYHFLNNEGVLILKLNANIAYRFNGKISKFYWLKNSLFWRILLVLTNISKTMAKWK